MCWHAHSSPSSRAFLAASLVAMIGLAGCDTSAGLVGKWETDRTDLLNSPSGENELAALLSPSPKFSVQFLDDGTCISSWQENGKDATRKGTWKLLENQGLKWRIAVKLPPDEEEWEVRVGSPENRKLSLQAADEFKKGGPIYFKKSW